jgi:hypothetical protein
VTPDPTDQQQFDNELRGALFKNDKGGNAARPDYRGTCTINGQEYKISAWLKQARSGMTFMSMAYTAVEPPPPAVGPDGGPPVQSSDFAPAHAPAHPADDIPF